MFVTIEIPAGGSSPQLQVPNAAVQEHSGKCFVFVHLGKEQFEAREVKVGESDQENTIVESGLSEGEPVVVQGGFILKSQMLAELMGEE